MSALTEATDSILRSFRRTRPTDIRTDDQLKTAFINSMADKSVFMRNLRNQGFTETDIKVIMETPGFSL